MTHTSTFHLVGSTGRTATTFIASAMNTINGVLALHEGYEGGSDETDPILPSINLENFLIYKSPKSAKDIINQKRNQKLITAALERAEQQTLIDVAYYNPTLARSILKTYENAHYVGIIRDAASFVRSAAFIEGEDIMAVGWPEPEKALTPREQFIAMGRLRPLRKTPEHELWKSWGTIERNIWLWTTTNALILDVKDEFPDRVTIIDFEHLKTSPKAFWTMMLKGLKLSADKDVLDTLTHHKTGMNKKSTGYQIGAISAWHPQQQALLERAQSLIDTRRNIEND